MILYFTGTGNSRYIAEKIAEITKTPLRSMNERLKKNDTSSVETGTHLVIVVPTYAWRIPRIVQEWIQKVDFIGNPKTYFVMDCGDSIGNANKYIKRLCAGKNFSYMGVAEIIMPENYIALYHAPEEKEARRIIENADQQITKVAEEIRDGIPLGSKSIHWKDKIYSGIVNPLFYKLIVKDKKFYAMNQCVGCGKCETACPLNNIQMESGKPRWNGNCTHCMACICGCPVEAIEYGNKSEGRVRYWCGK